MAIRRPLGHLQRRLIDALRQYGRPTSLDRLTALVADLVPALHVRPPCGKRARRATYVSVARAVAGFAGPKAIQVYDHAELTTSQLRLHGHMIWLTIPRTSWSAFLKVIPSPTEPVRRS